jgi:hypothetical protein
MNPKTKTKIRTAVKDYFEMFPQDWELVKPEIERMRLNKVNDFAELEGNQNLKRALFSVPEKLSSMIGLKLDLEERQLFSQKEHARWFATEFPMFRISKDV